MGEEKKEVGRCPTCQSAIDDGDMCISDDHTMTEHPLGSDVFYCDRCDAEFTFAELILKEKTDGLR